MFSALGQGSIVYILDKSDRTQLKTGLVLSVSLPKADYLLFNSIGTPVYVDLKVNVDGNTYEYNSIPSNSSLVSYNNGRITISETKQGLQNEVESILHNSKNILDRIDIYKQTVLDCEDILKQLNPQYAKDAERDERLNNLEERFGGVELRLDKIINLINK